MTTSHQKNRREVLQAIASFGTAALLPGMVSGSLPAFADQGKFTRRRSNLIREENKRPGTRQWILNKTAVDPDSKYRCPSIEGYASKTSVSSGDTISLYVSCNPESKFTIDLYRSGYYNGDGGRKITSLGTFDGKTQKDPAIGENRLRECQWDPCYELTIEEDWVSGVYLCKLTSLQTGMQSYITFIIKDDRKVDFLFQCSDTTWSAYNRWPSQYSLYDNEETVWYWGAGVDVSFDRPYGKYCQIFDAPLTTGSGEWFCWELPIAYWMESKGYDLSYCSNIDTHTYGEDLMRAGTLISVGHDEYYSLEMFNHVRAAIRGGLNVAFLSGNTCCGLLEIKPSSDGRPNRIISRVDRFGPRDKIGDDLFHSMKTLPRNAPNEADIIGARSTGPVVGGADYICQQPDHWLFAGSGMKKGEGIPGLVGWEWHGDPANIPGLEIVASGTTNSGSGAGTYTSTIYPGPKGNLVFNASSCWWGDGLSEPPGYVRPAAHGATPQGTDKRVQIITANLLDHLKTL
ncbi:MAG: hypothetical protein CMJ76_13275 [Planctomycetaceae bacterium]|nr:hypothetical protein [Planctomycetaceae bacterium]